MPAIKKGPGYPYKTASMERAQSVVDHVTAHPLAKSLDLSVLQNCGEGLGPISRRMRQHRRQAIAALDVDRAIQAVPIFHTQVLGKEPPGLSTQRHDETGGREPEDPRQVAPAASADS